MYIDICCITFTLVILYGPNQPFFWFFFFLTLKKVLLQLKGGKWGKDDIK